MTGQQTLQAPAPVTHKADAVAVAAVDQARDALVADVGADVVGEHLGYLVEAERTVTHLFESAGRGYRGWRWHVVVARAPRAKQVTVVEIALIPGEAAIVAPQWVPYRERIQPGDLSPGDLLPVADDDPRLVPTYCFGDDPLTADDKTQIREVARELGLGRVRTLSPEGRDLAAQRWYDGQRGPDSPLAQAAPHRCQTCGFMLRLSGSLNELFGVCANGDANDDGAVVSFDHGCGAHSEVQLARRHQPTPLPEHVYDSVADELDDL